MHAPASSRKRLPVKSSSRSTNQHLVEYSLAVHLLGCIFLDFYTDNGIINTILVTNGGVTSGEKEYSY